MRISLRHNSLQQTSGEIYSRNRGDRSELRRCCAEVLGSTYRTVWTIGAMASSSRREWMGSRAVDASTSAATTEVNDAVRLGTSGKDSFDGPRLPVRWPPSLPARLQNWSAWMSWPCLAGERCGPLNQNEESSLDHLRRGSAWITGSEYEVEFTAR